MSRNVEIKASVADIQRLSERVKQLSVEPPQVLWQEDTFFTVARGRLKLRTFADHSGELIYYERPDVAGPKESNYMLVPVEEPRRLREALAAAIGISAIVRKRRTLHMIGRTRLHLDEVEHLGNFLELEVVLCDGEEIANGIAEAQALMHALEIQDDQLIDRAYVDLLDERGSAPAPRVIR